MKKLLIAFAALIVFPLCAFAPKENECYKVKITFQVIQEIRSDYYNGTVLNSKVIKNDAFRYERVCANSESEAKKQAAHLCSSECSRVGNYIRKTTINGEEAYVFEVRKISEIEIVGSCGEC